MAIQAGKSGEMMIVLRVKDDGTAVIEKFGDTAEREGERAGLSWKKVGTAAGAAALAVATTAALMVKNSIDTADAAGKVADKLGMTTEGYTAMAYAAKATADVTRDNFGQAMRMMVDNLSQAAQGTGLARNAIADLGLNAKQLAEMGPEKAVLAISDAMEKIPNQGDRVRIAMDVFRNADMVNALKGGSGAMREMMEEARRLGQVIGDDTADNADAFNDNIDRLKATATGMANQMAAQLLPALVAISDAMVEAAADSQFLEAAGKTLATTLHVITTVGLGVAAAFEQTGTWIGAVGAAAAASASGEFRQAVEIIREAKADIDQINAEALTSMAKVWTGQAQDPNVIDADRARRAAAAGNTGRAGLARGETEKLREELAKQLVAIHESTTSEEQLMAEKYVKDFQTLQQSLDLKLLTQEQYDEQRQALADTYEQRASERHANDMIRMADSLTALEESLMTENDLLTEDYLTKQMLLDDALLNGAISQETYYQTLAQLTEQYEQKKTDAAMKGIVTREKAEQAANERNKLLWSTGYRAQLDIIGGVMSQASNLMQSGSKKQFEIGKKAAIASTLITTFQSAMSAFNALSGIPIVGPVLGAVAAAAAIAFGMAQVGKIRSQQFQGGGAGGGSVPSFSANPNTGLPTGTPGGDVGLPSSTLPPSPVAATTPARTVNLYMSGTDIYSAENIRDKLVPALNEAAVDGVTVNVRSF